MGDVFNFDIDGCWVQKIQSSAGQHALPSTGLLCHVYAFALYSQTSMKRAALEPRSYPVQLARIWPIEIAPKTG